MMKCSVWTDKHFTSGASAIVSTCPGGVTLSVRPDDWARRNGPSSYRVEHKGKIVRRGYTKTLRAAKSAARRQAGATGGVP